MSSDGDRAERDSPLRTRLRVALREAMKSRDHVAIAAVDAHPARARVHLSGGLWLTMRAATIGAGGIEPGDQIAVSIEESSPAERLDLFARASGLSGRETELLGLLAKGHDTRTIARLMFLSEHTVQDHLKSIFSKTTAINRKTLLSRAVGA